MPKKVKKTFDQFYSLVYLSRWESLRESLLNEKTHFEFYKDEQMQKPYFLDEASLYPVKALNIKPNQSVFDMCAAPGGKSLQVLCALKGQGEVLLNEMSKNRRFRLQRVIEEHMKSEFIGLVNYSNRDASLMGKFHIERFDKILLDAPCSSERHHINDLSKIEAWSETSSKKLAIRQMGLLCSALDALKPGGEMVYSTCSISPYENDNVIEKLLKKRKGKLEVSSLSFDKGESTEFGWQLFPDVCDGIGPIYLCSLKKMT